ncbi:MAG: VWA domain-containing protein [Candidatus Schekmanbacteria bacterium]|nr:VWA domain-containing protein [Candidatus Schekmanbacteria bacterium]
MSEYAHDMEENTMKRTRFAVAMSAVFTSALLLLLPLGGSGCSVGSKDQGRSPEPAPVPEKLLSMSLDAGSPGLEKMRAVASRMAQPPQGERDEPSGSPNAEQYDRIDENPFLTVAGYPLSTFSIDVDTASYSNVRRFLRQGQLPPPYAVRLEELVNYFDYDYPEPEGGAPFSATVEAASCPWNRDHRLVRIGLKGRVIPTEQRPPANLVFLLDVSGSMKAPNRLPLLKTALKMLVNNLNKQDRVAIVVYAGASGLVLPSTACDNSQAILEALENLVAGGSTDAGSGIELAYQVARENFLQIGTNRVILATDGDFNVGITNRGDLKRLIEEKARSGVFLTVLGFGMGNLKDATLEELADHGNGSYAFIDDAAEARKVFVEQIGGTLVTIAKDVKIQVEFNPETVAGYRLLGYENRILRSEDFNDDTKDAGEVGAGHTVTALYEVVPAGFEVSSAGSVDPLTFQKPAAPSGAADTNDMVLVKLRYKDPTADTSQLLSWKVRDLPRQVEAASGDFRFAAAVAGFGMLLRESRYRGTASFDSVEELARGARGQDPHGYRSELVELVRLAKSLSGGTGAAAAAGAGGAGGAGGAAPGGN